MLAQRLRRYTNSNQALVQITAVFVACLVVISCLLYIYAYLGHVELFLVDV